MTGKSTFKPEYIETAKKLAALGAVDREIAAVIGISERTLHRWKLEHEGFAKELKLGKEAADQRVEQSLYHRAIGYSYDNVKIGFYDGKPVVAEYLEHVPPDTTAAIFWLKNRRPEDWRDKREIDFGPPKELRPGDMAVRLAAIASRHIGELEGQSDDETN